MTRWRFVTRRLRRAHYNGAMKRVLAVALLALAAVSARAELPFIENDYAKAVARAKAKNVPIFVEAWAPW